MDSVNKEKIDLYYPMIYKYVLIQIKNPSDAQDITQEVFYKYFLHSIPFENAEKEKSWLFTVASNLCKNYWRSVWYKKTVPLHVNDSYTPPLNTVHSFYQSKNPEKIFEEEELQKKVFSCMMHLSPHYREVLYLFYYEELPIAEISRITGRNISTIQTQLARGRKKMKKLWEKPSGTRPVFSFAAAALIISILLGGSAYAAHIIQKNVAFTENGNKTDASASENKSGSKLIHSYDTVDSSSSSSDTPSSVSGTNEILTFDSWARVKEITDFPLVHPASLPSDTLQITYQICENTENIAALYTSDTSELVIKYISFVHAKNWDYANDYNGAILKQWTHTNEYGYCFSVCDVQYEDFQTSHAVIAFPDYYIQYSFTGFSEEEICSILNELNLSVYHEIRKEENK